MSEFIGTRSGCKINLDDPQPDDFILDDIAIGLSHVARFNGQTDWHYSVAQHSVLVARYLLARYNDTTLALQGLLHDASESVICDLPTPVKRLIGRSIMISKLGCSTPYSQSLVCPRSLARQYTTRTFVP